MGAGRGHGRGPSVDVIVYPSGMASARNTNKNNRGRKHRTSKLRGLRRARSQCAGLYLTHQRLHHHRLRHHRLHLRLQKQRHW